MTEFGLKGMEVTLHRFVVGEEAEHAAIVELEVPIVVAIELQE